ncbi:MAG: RluA family pseudouridine synthase [Clostridia bacterium]|nr:RluA family pseudouridine synthase [Clostridia bacterium]
MSEMKFTVPPEYDGESVQTFLRQCHGFSWRMVVRLKHTENGITVNGQLRRSIDRIRTGEELVLRLPEDAIRVEESDLPLNVVYEDDSLLVVDKPPYLAVHPSAFKPEPTLANVVVGYYAKHGQSHAFRPTNRLDRNTSGLLLTAKNAHVAYALAHKVDKTYLAIVLGKLEGEGVIDQPIRIKDGCTITREVGEGGKESRTHYKALATDGEITLVRLWLETGRTHQIRVHMSWLGFPLVGDTMYGTDESILPRHALHCAEMAFTHPLTGERVKLYSPLPPDMKECLAKHGLEEFA